MPITLLGADALRGLLAGRGNVRVVNRTSGEDAVEILAAAIVRHRSTGAVADATYHLDLQADESIELEEMPPSAARPERIEVMLRLRVGPLEESVDAYATAARAIDDPDAVFEVGVRRHDGEIVDGENTLAGFAEFAVYGRPVG